MHNGLYNNNAVSLLSQLLVFANDTIAQCIWYNIPPFAKSIGIVLFQELSVTVSRVK